MDINYKMQPQQSTDLCKLKDELEVIQSLIINFRDYNCLTDHAITESYTKNHLLTKFPYEFTNKEKKIIEDEKKILLNSYEKIKNIYNDKIKVLEKEFHSVNVEIEEFVKKQKENDMKNGCKTIKELYNLLPNPNQKDIFSKILSDSEYAKIYLSNYDANTDPKKSDIHGTITVLGTYNSKKQEREVYSIKIYKQSDKGTFWCSCPDHKFNSAKKNTVCKHICFIVCKILKYLNVDFFTDKKLSEEQINTLIKKLTSADLAEIDKSLINKITRITKELFMNFTKQIDDGDDCPICFESINEKHKLACPACHNYIHEECMLVCLEKRDSCIYCMNDIWKNYKKLTKTI
jgi:hypothetical protein